MRDEKSTYLHAFFSSVDLAQIAKQYGHAKCFKLAGISGASGIQMSSSLPLSALDETDLPETVEELSVNLKACGSSNTGAVIGLE